VDASSYNSHVARAYLPSLSLSLRKSSTAPKRIVVPAVHCPPGWVRSHAVLAYETAITIAHNTHPVLTLFRLPLDGDGSSDVQRPYGDARDRWHSCATCGR